MTKRLLVVVLLTSSAAVLTLAQQPSSLLEPPRKQQLNDVGTPGVLLPLRTTPIERPALDGVERETLPQLEDQWATDATTGAQYRRGQLLVRFRNGSNTTARTQALQRSGASRVATMPLPANWELVAVPEDPPLADTAAALMRSGTADEVSLNYRATKHQFRPNDEGFSLQWNFDAINLPLAWQINPGATNNVVVAVIDTGMNTVNGTFGLRNPLGGTLPIRFSTVPDLVTDGRIVSPYDFVYGDTQPLDTEGHGTHVAGTIAQQTNNNIGAAGVAYNVKLMPLKVLASSWDALFLNRPTGGAYADIAAAIRYAADNSANIINMSLGGTASATIVRDAIQYAVGKGVFVSMSAGNDAEDGNPMTYPAAYASNIAGAVAVGAVNRSLKRATYSTFHDYVEICAPGGQIETSMDFQRGITQVTYDESATLAFFSPADLLTFLRLGFRPTFDRFELTPYDGTSMASPHAAGVAALLYSQGIHNPAAIEAAIKKFAKSISATKDECGAGLIDARAALRGLGLSR
jgi:serine protease